MKKVLIALLLLGCSSVAHADNWIFLFRGGSSDNYMDSYMGNWWLTNDYNGDPVVATRIRSVWLRGNVSFVIDYITIKDCKVGYGQVVMTDLRGNPVGANDFVFGGETGASIIAETLCGFAKSGSRM